ncbi:hypothetical protein WI29_24540 [Burkholderia ubonensis]|nr:hypothetical protein WI29_24540 [Burkholderia ubonensis]KUZ29681.1 hypothetical protein WI32_26665 [Burkholderia ubonensis]KUZ46200.1 hypothetical protein WI33_25015 [Burkholderia ubonensis]KUZ58075.1 hypothetical protein WI34_16780 [Burkholderia ubonensis]
MVDDVAVMPGSLATPAVVECTKRKEALLALVQQFADQGFSYTPERDGRISHDTAAAARALFHILLPGYDAPKISPDGEGGLIAVWDQADQKTLLVIDNWRLHLVTNATTPGARYFDDLPFDGERVPDPVAELLPSS